MINTTIGKYKITRLIGEGGMASVYEAEHEMLGTNVSFPIIRPFKNRIKLVRGGKRTRMF